MTGLENDQLASSSQKNINIWNIIPGQEEIKENTLEGHTNTVKSILALPNNRLASGSDDKTIIIWNLESGDPIHKLEGHVNCVMALILMNGGLKLASASRDKTIKYWDIESGMPTKTLQGHEDWVTSLALFEDGRLVSSSKDKSIIIWKKI